MARETGGLLDVADAVRRRWRAFALVAVPLVVGVGGYVQSLPDAYDGTAVVTFSPRTDQDLDAGLLRVIVTKYVVYVSSRATAQSVAVELGEDEDVLRTAIDASVAPETANLSITVRLSTPERARDAANTLAKEAVALSGFDEKLSGRVIAPALAEESPSAPPRTLLLGGGVLLALGAGLVAAVITERSRPRITDALSLALTSQQPTLGRIPLSRALRAGPLDALADNVVGTSVRALRTQVEQRTHREPAKIIAVTSPGSNDGKTTAAVLLAGAFARVDRSVLVIDADLRRPRVAEAVGMTARARPLNQVLAGRARVEDVVRATDVKNLSVIVAEPDEDAGDLLARRLQVVLDEASRRFDVVIVDCPPVLATDDARTVALRADATVLVVSAGTDSGRVAAAVGALESLEVRVLGCVLNRSRISRREDLGSYGAYTARD